MEINQTFQYHPCENGCFINFEYKQYPRGYSDTALSIITKEIQKDGLALESCTFEEFDRFYNPGEPFFIPASMVFVLEDSLSYTFSRVPLGLKKLAEKINAHGNARGKNISVMPDAKGEHAIIVGKPKKQFGIPTVSVGIPLNDGQVIYAVFHAEDGSSKVVAKTKMMVYRWLLNKKDISRQIIRDDEEGKKVNVNDLGLQLVELASANHDKFIMKKSTLGKKQDELNDLIYQIQVKKQTTATFDKNGRELVNKQRKLEKEERQLNTDIQKIKKEIAKKRKQVEKQADQEGSVKTGKLTKEQANLKAGTDDFSAEMAKIGFTEVASDDLSKRVWTSEGVTVTAEVTDKGKFRLTTFDDGQKVKALSTGAKQKAHTVYTPNAIKNLAKHMLDKKKPGLWVQPPDTEDTAADVAEPVEKPVETPVTEPEPPPVEPVAEPEPVVTPTISTESFSFSGKDVWEAYQKIKQNVRVSNIRIYELQQELNAPMDQVKAFVLKASQQGNAVISRGEWSIASDEIRTGAIEVRGEPYLLVRFKDGVQDMYPTEEPEPEPEPEPIPEPEPAAETPESKAVKIANDILAGKYDHLSVKDMGKLEYDIADDLDDDLYDLLSQYTKDFTKTAAGV